MHIQECDAVWVKPLVSPLMLILQMHTVPACWYKAKDLQLLILVLYTKGFSSPVNKLLFDVPIPSLM